MNKYKINIVNQNASSAKFGPCEVCNKHASEVFHVWSEEWVENGDDYFYTQHKNVSLFGHKDCCLSKMPKED